MTDRFPSDIYGFPTDFPVEMNSKTPLGVGSFAAVFKGIDKKTKEERAVKVVDLKKLQAKSHYAESEMRILMLLQSAKHPSLVNLYGSFKLNESYVALVLEMCELGDLSSYMAQQPNKRVSEGTAKKLMQDLAMGLRFLKSKNIIHRDLKPQNLLLTKKNGTLWLKLADFGFAKELGAFDQMLTSMVGSPMYVAPELWRSQPYTTKSDLWSVGVIFFEVCFGYYLYFAKTLPDLMKLVENQEVRYPRQLVSEFSPECMSLMKKLLQKDPMKRIEWDDYLNDPWLELGSREIVDSFFFLQDAEEKTQDGKEQNGKEQTQDGKEQKKPKRPFSQKEENQPISESFGNFDIAKAVTKLALALQQQLPAESLSLYMEALGLLKDLLKSNLKEQLSRAESEEANSLFQKCYQKAEDLTKRMTEEKIPNAKKVIFENARDIGRKAEIDEVFGDNELALEGYSTALLFLNYVSKWRNLEPQSGNKFDDYIDKYSNARAYLIQQQKGEEEEEEKEEEEKKEEEE